VVGNGNGGHLELAGLLYKGRWTYRAVKKAVLRMEMKVYESAMVHLLKLTYQPIFLYTIFYFF